MARGAWLSASWVQPSLRSWCRRQARMRAAETSMAESTPKPTRLTDPAATPRATAITPSALFHPMVSMFRTRARRTAAARSTVATSAEVIEVLVGVVHLELEVDQVGEGVGQPARRQLVAHLAPLAHAPHQPAPAQAGEVVGDVGATDAELLGQVGRI